MDVGPKQWKIVFVSTYVRPRAQKEGPKRQIIGPNETKIKKHGSAEKQFFNPDFKFVIVEHTVH